MERIKDTHDLNQVIRPGTTWVNGFTQPGNNDDLRSIDSDGAEMRIIPASRYYASCTIKRGQAVSIAQLVDLPLEFQQNKYAYVKLTDPDLDETCIGIAMNYAEAGDIVQIQSSGKFTYNTTASILCTEAAKETEVFLNSEGWNFDSVRGQKLYLKKLYNNPLANAEGVQINTETGDAFDTSHEDRSVAADTENIFTYDIVDSIYNVKNTIQVGYLTDAPTTDKHYYFREGDKWYQKISEEGSKDLIVEVTRDVAIVALQDGNIVTTEDVTLTSTGVTIPAGSVPPKAHEAVWMVKAVTENSIDYYTAVDDTTVTIEVNVTGDTRGPVDNTQFILTLGETIYFDKSKRNVELLPPHYNEGIFDEVKVVAIAEGQPTGPCFRVFSNSEGGTTFVKVEAFEEGKVYYGKYPGNLYKRFDNMSRATFEGTYERATTWMSNTQFYTLGENGYELATDVNVNNFDSEVTRYFCKIDFYELTDSVDKAFISLRKIDGDTYIIPVLNDFTLEDLQQGTALIDPNDEGYIKLSLQFTAGVPQNHFIKAETFESNVDYYILETLNTVPVRKEFVKVEAPKASEIGKYYYNDYRAPKVIIGPSVQSITRDALKDAIVEGMKAIFVDDETGKTSCTSKTYNIGDNGFQFITEENGGSYDIYVSSNLLSVVSATQMKHGQSAKAGEAILADIRDADRLNVAGIVLSNETGIRHAGETIKVMKMGRLVTLGNLRPGQAYFLGLNGRITTKNQYWYDHAVPIGIADAPNYFIVNVCQYPAMSYSGSLPLGYIKPSVYGMAEKGFLMADGHTAYNKDEYPEMYNYLLSVFSEEELRPSNVTEDMYNRYEACNLGQVFTDIFTKLASIEVFNHDQNQAIIDLITDAKNHKDDFEKYKIKQADTDTEQTEALEKFKSEQETKDATINSLNEQLTTLTELVNYIVPDMEPVSYSSSPKGRSTGSTTKGLDEYVIGTDSLEVVTFKPENLKDFKITPSDGSLGITGNSVKFNATGTHKVTLEAYGCKKKIVSFNVENPPSASAGVKYTVNSSGSNDITTIGNRNFIVGDTVSITTNGSTLEGVPDSFSVTKSGFSGTLSRNGYRNYTFNVSSNKIAVPKVVTNSGTTVEFDTSRKATVKFAAAVTGFELTLSSLDGSANTAVFYTVNNSLVNDTLVAKYGLSFNSSDAKVTWTAPSDTKYSDLLTTVNKITITTTNNRIYTIHLNTL